MDKETLLKAIQRGKPINRIRFSGSYVKLKEFNLDEPVMLMEIFKTSKEKLSKTFISYDTLKTNGDYYRLPAGPLIMLLFIEPKTKKIFTTLRTYNQFKWGHYQYKRGEMFKIDASD